MLGELTHYCEITPDKIDKISSYDHIWIRKPKKIDNQT